MELNKEMEELENKVVTALLSGDHPILRALYSQWQQINTKKIEYSGAGFFVNYCIREDVAPLPGHPSFTISDVDVKIKGLKYDLACLLFVKNGKIEMLEGATSGESWPESIEVNEILYIPGPERDLKKLIEKLS